MSIRSWAVGLRAGGSGEPARVDRWLLFATLLLVGGGLAMVLSASQALATQQHGFALHYFVRQLELAMVGLVLLGLLSRVDYRRLAAWSPVPAAAVAILMVAVLVPAIGVEVNGARRWLNLGPLGSFQPSEAAKLVFTLFLARWIHRRQDRLQSFGDGFVPFAILTAGVLGLLMLQKDLGTAAVMCAIFISVYFAGGGRKRHVAVMLGVLAAAFVFLIFAEPYRMRRIDIYLNPFADPLASGFQPVQALIGLGSGGIFGIGLGHSIQKFAWLPEAHTDFIFAIVGEETGLIGTTLVMAGFVAVAVRGYRTAAHAPDRLGVMVATGITTWIAFQALINMATVTDTLPTTGLPLPFISYGGTALAIAMAAMGILLNIGAQSGEQAHPRSRRTDATVDLGRRDWRTPLASARRRSGVPR